MWISALCLSALFMVHVVHTQTSDPLSTDNPSVQTKITNIMNDYRRAVSPTASNMVAVKWNNEAAKTALKWAQTCSFEHSDPSQRTISKYGCGENLYMSSNAATWETVCKAWYDEKKDFDYGKGPKKTGDVVGHYTQMVWYSSCDVGCAYAHCPNKKYNYFYVCHHCPPGNVNSVNFPYKNGTNCADCPKNCNNGMCTNPCQYVNKYSNCNDLKQYCKQEDNVRTGCQASCNCPTQIY